MKLKRILSLFVVTAIIAASLVTTAIPVMADTVSVVSDDFESYTAGLSKWSSNNYASLGNSFVRASWLAVNKTDFEVGGDADKLFQIVSDESFGTGRVLKVTTQKNLNSATWIAKKSGITNDISGKTLVFTADFTVPEDNELNLGNGVAVYLDLDSDNAPYTKWSFHNGTATFLDGSTFSARALLGIEKDSDSLYVSAFGEKLQSITAGVGYSYTLTLEPAEGGKYTASAQLNESVINLTGKYLPTADVLKTYVYLMVGAKSNPDRIRKSYSETGEGGNTTYDINKYPNDKTVALLDNLSLNAVSKEELGDTLFADTFDNYGSAEYVPTASSTDVSNYRNDTFTVRSEVSSSERTTSDETKAAPITAGDREKIAKLAEEQFGGTGKTLQLTSQGLVARGAMYKKSNISADTIAGKALVYTASFKISEEGPYNDGVGFAAGLSATRVKDGVTEPNVFYHDVNQPITKEMAAGSNSYKLFAAQGMDFWVFGEKMCTLQKGVTYNYTLKLVPNSDGSTYRAVAQLNDEVKEITSEVPTIAEMASNEFAFVALHNQSYPTAAGAVGTGYANDKPLVYIDDIKLERKDPSEVELPKPDTAPTDEELGAYGLFDEDFEDYTVDYVKKASADEIAQYEKNSFVLNYNAKTTTPTAIGHQDGRITTGDVLKLFKISKNSSFGSGANYLNVQTQGLITGGTMWTRSNITADRINNKTLVFKTKFKIPANGEWGAGSGAAVVFADKKDEKIPNGAIGSRDMSVSDLDGKYGFAVIAANNDGTANNTLKVFGENIATDIVKGQKYDVTVTMIPDSDGKYAVTVQLGDIVKTLGETAAIPGMTELGTYSFAGIVSHANSWYTGSRYEANAPYQPDKDLIYFDDISLKRAGNFVLDTTKGANGISDLTVDGKIDMAKKYITLNLGETITSADVSKITIDNEASVKSAEIDSANNKALKITFENLKLKANYKINVAGVINPIGIEFKQEFTLNTSAGIDVAYENIKLTGTTVTVPVSKNSGVAETVKPSVIVCVYDISNPSAPLLKKSYIKEDEVTTQKNIEVTGIEYSTGDKVRVFVWNGLTTMSPLVKCKDVLN